MKTKTFKVGEYGYCEKYKVTCKGDKVIIDGITSNLNVKQETFNLKDLNYIDDYMCEETTPYYSSLVMEFLKC